MNRSIIVPSAQAILAAFLFGTSAPLSKLFLGVVDPVLLASFLYLGSGVALFLFQTLRWNGPAKTSEAPIKKTDIKWLAGAILAGGILAPIILLFGLRSTPGATASLLLNFEGVATTLIAAAAFKEAVSRQAWWAILAITAASILLSLTPGDHWGISWGALAILAACVLWGADNNFTRNISSKDPVSIVMVKGIVAGSFSLILAILLGNQIPDIDTVLKAMLLGSLSYGLSIVLFIKAMRGLGAARTSAFFGTAPLSGVAVSFLLLREPAGMMLLVALPLMLIGALLLVFDDHNHYHLHEAVFHEHWHKHDDDHHHHAHDDHHSGRAHSHHHEHAVCEHAHFHMPDLQHRHTHKPEPGSSD